MLILARLTTPCRMVITQGDVKFKQSQQLRIESVAFYKEAGEYLIQIRSLLKGAKPSKPCETDFGSFNSFNHFLTEKGDELLGITKRTAYNYIKLAENWDIVLKLGMQSMADADVDNSMRICRTIKIVTWYKAKIKTGADPNTLTLDLYWLEDKAKKDKKGSEEYKELLKERDLYRSERDYYKERCQILEEQLAATLT